MWKCRPASSSGPPARRRAIPSGASASENPNFESAWPVVIAAWVAPATPGVIRSSAVVAPRRVRSPPPRRAGRSRRSCRRRGARRRWRDCARSRRRTWRCRGRRSRSGSKPARNARCSSPAEATSQPRPSSARIRRIGGAGKAFDANTHAGVGVPGLESAAERARTGAQVVLGDDVRGRAELARELERVAAAYLQAPAIVDPAAERIDVGELLGRRHRRLIIAGALCPHRERWHDRRGGVRARPVPSPTRSASTPASRTRAFARPIARSAGS